MIKKKQVRFLPVRGLGFRDGVFVVFVPVLELLACLLA